MSLEVWGDEGDVPTHGRETAAFQELATIREKINKWCRDFKSELNPDELAAVNAAMGKIDESLELMDVKL